MARIFTVAGASVRADLVADVGQPGVLRLLLAAGSSCAQLERGEVEGGDQGSDPSRDELRRHPG